MRSCSSPVDGRALAGRLPLAERTVAAIFDHLLDGRPAAHDLAPLLEIDPALAAWCVARAGAQRPSTVTEAAAWLADAFAPELFATLPIAGGSEPFAGDNALPLVRDNEAIDATAPIGDGNHPIAGPASAECGSAGDDLASDGLSGDDLASDGLSGDDLSGDDLALAAARVVERAAAVSRLALHHGADADRAYLAGLLYDGAVIGDSRSPGFSTSAGNGAAAPHASDLPLDPRSDLAAASWFVRAVRCAGSLDELGELTAADTQFIRRQAHRARRHWLDSSSAAARRLVALARRLARLNELESRFADALRTAKLDAMKELAYGASHEINNPLANISTRAQTLLQTEIDPVRRQMLATINRQAFRAHEMIADMMLFARPPQPSFEVIELAHVVERVVGELAADARRQATQLVPRAPRQPVVLRADPVQLAVALRAVLVNALEALGSGGRIDIQWHCVPREANHQQAGRFDLPDAKPATQSDADVVQILVRDDGPGLDPRAREHLFDPFFSGREAGRGLGFGLSKCWRILTAHGGRIDVGDAPRRGTQVVLTLPLEQPPVSSASPDECPAAGSP
jgi:signal transduction histidine kinase